MAVPYLEHFLDSMSSAVIIIIIIVIVIIIIVIIYCFINCLIILNKGLETLPADLQRNFTLMRDLDSKTEGMFPLILLFIFVLI